MFIAYSFWHWVSASLYCLWMACGSFYIDKTWHSLTRRVRCSQTIARFVAGIFTRKKLIVNFCSDFPERGLNSPAHIAVRTWFQNFHFVIGLSQKLMQYSIQHLPGYTREKS